jgi:protein-disulfide isomerase
MVEEKKIITIKLPKINIWMIFTVILAILLVVFYFKGWTFTGMAVVPGLTPQQAADKAINYINQNLVQTGQVTFVSVEDQNGLYVVTTSYQGQQIPVYVTKDGSQLFVSSPINMTEEIETSTTQPEEIPKTNKPLAELFVMAFCPYGVQAENLMKPVVDLLGTKADIKIRFIANVQGDTASSVSSLHGANEAMEDLRQLCIMKNYDQKTFWNYLMEIDANCSSIYSNATALDQCWKNAATKAGIDVTKIDTCSKGSEGLDLLKADEQLTEKYGVSGSPTLIINGVQYSGTRSSEAFKQAICSAFNTQPSECSQTLSASTGSASGGCQ